ncbi:MAG: Lrp/AsnC ligand binding domain-containing protein [Archaeoglobaceae archaeon]
MVKNIEDLKIALKLIKNGRMKKIELAKILNVTEAAIRKRIEKMEKNRIILGYRAVVDYKKLGLFSSLTGIDVEPEKLWHVVEKLKSMDKIYSLYLTSGDHVIIAEVICESMESLISFHEEISKMEGVKRVCPSVILEVIR